MRRLVPLLLAGACALAVPSLATADPGKGRDHREDRGSGHDRENGRGDRGSHGRGDDRGRGAARDFAEQQERVVRDARRDWDRAARDARRDRDEAVRDYRRVAERNWNRGCPPGLVAISGDCLPPGQVRRAADRQWRDWRWVRDAGAYRYDNGYVYRVGDNGGLSGWLPVLGGALGLGSLWPQNYSYQPVPRYQTDYWRLAGPYDYRVADNVVYAVNPQTNNIGQVAALLSGSNWNVGQAMPAGYDVYNVPYGYRDRYADSADRWYRYDNGQVYQIDPTTRLVQAVIQLLT